jgi:hypothetical protein
MMRAHWPFCCICVLGALLLTTSPLPAPVTVLPEPTPKPTSKPAPKATPKPLPKQTPRAPNPHGVPDGTYDFPPQSRFDPPIGNSVNKNYFVVHGNTFEWWMSYEFTPNEAGRQAGRVPESNRYKVTGPISRRPDGMLSFSLASIQLVASQPKDNPRSRVQIDKLHAQMKQGAGCWSLAYANGNLFEPSSGNAWSPRR